VLSEIFRRLKALWVDWRRPAWKVAYIEDPPEQVKQGRLYIVGTADDPFQAVMACPCGCGRPIYLDLVRSRDAPSWKLDVSGPGLASLSPSVWRKDGCLSHFWLKAGQIRWC
jgi:hypothetical protein